MKEKRIYSVFFLALLFLCFSCAHQANNPVLLCDKFLSASLSGKDEIKKELSVVDVPEFKAYRITENKSLQSQTIDAEELQDVIRKVESISRKSARLSEELEVWNRKYEEGQIDEITHRKRLQFFGLKIEMNNMTIEKLTKDFNLFIALWKTGRISDFIGNRNLDVLDGNITVTAHEVRAKLALSGEKYDHLFVFKLAKIDCSDCRGKWKIFFIEDLYAKN